MISFFLCSYKIFLRVTEFAHLIWSNDISHVFTSTNQETFFDQSQFISVVFLVVSLVFSCCVSVFLGILLYLILSPVSVFVQKLS